MSSKSTRDPRDHLAKALQLRPEWNGVMLVRPMSTTERAYLRPTPLPRHCQLQCNKWGTEKASQRETVCDKDLAERSGELSGAICLKTLVLLGSDR